MLIAIVLYDGMTALDAIGPYEVLRTIHDADLRFVSNTPGPVVTERRSSSLPTQQNTNSAPIAASAGVAACDPPCSFAQACALAAVRL